MGHRATGDLPSAIRELLECTGRPPDMLLCRLELLATYMIAGQEELAREQAREVLRIHPGYSVEEQYWANAFPDPEQREQNKQYLYRAGLN